MRLAGAGYVRLMAGMHLAFIDHHQALRRKALPKLCFYAFSQGHAMGSNPVGWSLKGAT
ncbi:hypothetical protein AGR1C_Lc30144 [Agrobacterium fabacearum TT111]|nr:hypothetical protein AGR1C_Lc30144 [Agrobacterium fabacearum TT111]